jgi:HEAT repeat protein
MRNHFAFISGKMLVPFGLAAILFIFVCRPLLAQQYYESMTAKIGRADAVIFAEVKDGRNPHPPAIKLVDNNSQTAMNSDGLQPIAEFRIELSHRRYCVASIIELLKGDLPRMEIVFSPYHVDFKPGRQVVLLRKESDGDWWEAGFYPEDFLPKLRCMIPILQERSEPVRIQSLIQLLQKPSSICPQVAWKSTVDTSNPDPLARYKDMNNPVSMEALNDDVLFAIKEIKDPASFDIVAGTIGSFSRSGQKDLLDWVISTGDSRAVSVLLKFLDSKDENLSGLAAGGLRRHFPGAPGVTEAFRKSWKTADKAVRSEAVDYLIKREPEPDLQKAYEELHSPPHSTDAQNLFSMKARKTFKEGQTADAKRYCIQVIQDDSLYDQTRLYLADCITTALNREDQNRHLPAIAPFLKRMVSARNSFASYSAIRIVLSVKHPAMKQALVAYLNRDATFSIWRREAYRTVMALREMGEEARTASARVLLERIETISEDDPTWSRPLQRLIALVWLGNDRDFNRAQQFLEKNAPGYYSKFAADLKPISKMNDEGAFLIDLLTKHSNQSSDSLNWFIMRLGDIRDARAMPLLLSSLEKKQYFSAEPVSEALVQLGNSAVSRMESILRREDLKDYFYTGVLKVLFDSQKEKSLPFIRQLTKDRPTDLPPDIWYRFSQYGTAEDIALLSPLNDYWKYGPNSALQIALAALREKFGYDLSGPIEKREK